MWLVRKEECLKCGACVSVCPVMAIELKNNGVVNDKSLCTLCGLCEKICPVGVIEVSKND